MATIIDENRVWTDSASGKPIVDGLVFIGTQNNNPTTGYPDSTPNAISIYSDRDLSVSLPNPVSTGSDGRATSKIWIPDVRYSIVVWDENGTQQYISLDNGTGSDGANPRYYDDINAVLLDLSSIESGDALVLKDGPNGGIGTWDVVLGSTVTNNAYGIVDLNGTLSIVMRPDSGYVDSIGNLLKMNQVDGAVSQVLSYHLDLNKGGGHVVYDASEDKANHDGVTVFDPDRPFPTDWTNETQKAAWYTAGTGTGAFKRLTNAPYAGIQVVWSGAKEDEINNDYIPLTAISSMLAGGETVDFTTGKTYLISKSGTPTSPYGHRTFDLDGIDNITFSGNGATIKVVNHDISVNGGLSFIFNTACAKLTVDKLYFDMTFTGVHNSSTQYPFCGAIIGYDESNAISGVRDQTGLNHDWIIKRCKFKLYHQYGQFAQSGSSYLGDPNNGYKLFPVFVSGPSDATTYSSQCRNVTISKCVLEEGHNGYGFWAWAWNSVKMTKSRAESFVGKQSNNLGVYSGVGEPMMRYHQFYCTGLTVINNYFRAKPCSERTTVGFEGDARFVDYNTNLTGDHAFGSCIITGNEIIDGKGDLANSASDNIIYLFAYGNINVSNNTFDSTTDTVNANVSTGINWNAQAKAADPDGKATLKITANEFGANCDRMNNISINNGAATIAKRRLKQLIIADNTTLGQYQYFVQSANSTTIYGVQDLKIVDNLIDGEFNTTFPPANTNSRAIEVASSESNDIGEVSRNIIRSKYYGIENSGYTSNLIENDNEFIGVTTKFLGTVGRVRMTSISAVASILPTAQDGSIYIRSDGVAGSAQQQRIGGVWVNVV